MFANRPSLRRILTVLAWAGLAGLAPAGSLAADFKLPVAATQPLQPESIRQSAPRFLVRADVDRATRSYREGDRLSITVASEADTYVYVLYKQADGKVYQIFPNSVQPSNRLKARQAVQIPASDEMFRWVVGPPFGTEYVKVIASTKPLGELSDAAMRTKFFNPVSDRNLKGIELELGKSSTRWAEDCCQITTYPADSRPVRPGSRRFGLLIGIGDYQHIKNVADWPVEGRKPAPALVALPGHRDARLLGGVLQEVGQLNQMRILTNGTATRAKIEKAMTEWLPSVSQPGDTVILFFSGLTVPIPQSANRQADHSRVVLACHEQMLLEHVQHLAKKYKAGKLDQDESAQLYKALEIIGPAATNEEMQAALARGFGIGDELFVHWLQALAGRQILVIFDASYASAFGPKQASDAAAGLAVGGLADGIARLRTLGQTDIAFLAAAETDAFDVPRDPEGLSLMTGCLIHTLQQATGSLDIEQAFRQIVGAMETHDQPGNRRPGFGQKETTIANRLLLINNCAQRAWLKP